MGIALGLHRANQMIPEVTNALDDVDPTVSHLDRAACTSYIPLKNDSPE
jgi:hypothetical protein